MPGLLRGVARTAVIAGTATAVSNRVSRRQSNRWASQEQQADEAQQYQAQQYAPPPQQYAPPPQQYAAPAPAPAPTGGQDDLVAQLQQLANLKATGVLTDAEFETAKARVLAGSH